MASNSTICAYLDWNLRNFKPGMWDKFEDQMTPAMLKQLIRKLLGAHLPIGPLSAINCLPDMITAIRSCSAIRPSTLRIVYEAARDIEDFAGFCKYLEALPDSKWQSYWIDSQW